MTTAGERQRKVMQTSTNVSAYHIFALKQYARRKKEERRPWEKKRDKTTRRGVHHGKVPLLDWREILDEKKRKTQVLSGSVHGDRRKGEKTKKVMQTSTNVSAYHLRIEEMQNESTKIVGPG
jgi:hypothetical protein